MLTKYQQSTINRALKIMESSVLPNENYNGSSKIKDFLRLKLANELDENFGVIFMNSHYTFIAYETICTGTVNEAIVYARTIMRSALHHNASIIVLAHNHPSGVAFPSEADKGITQKLKADFFAFNIKIVDHIIVTKDKTYSFAESGTL